MKTIQTIQIMLPITVRYNGIKRQANTKFEASEKDIDMLIKLGGWVYADGVKKKQEPIIEKQKTKSRKSKKLFRIDDDHNIIFDNDANEDYKCDVFRTCLDKFGVSYGENENSTELSRHYYKHISQL